MMSLKRHGWPSSASVCISWTPVHTHNIVHFVGNTFKLSGNEMRFCSVVPILSFVAIGIFMEHISKVKRDMSSGHVCSCGLDLLIYWLRGTLKGIVSTTYGKHKKAYLPWSSRLHYRDGSIYAIHHIQNKRQNPNNHCIRFKKNVHDIIQHHFMIKVLEILRK